METTQTQPRNAHPLILIAAIALIVFAAVGTAAILGWIPVSTGNQSSDASRLAEAPPAAETPKAAPTVKSAAKPTAQARSDVRPVTRSRAAGSEVTTTTQPVYAPPATVQVARTEPAKPACLDCGVIESVREIEKKGEGSGLGAAAGGVLGGILGHQVGGGRGQDVMTVVGAVGGAVAGHQVEKNVKKTVSYEITVRFNDGTTRTLEQKNAPTWRPGDKVRVVNSQIVAG